MQVSVRKEVYKKISGFPKEVQQELLSAIELLSAFPSASLDIEKMKGSKNMFRVRIGSYRILFISERNTIYVFDADTRSKIYK